MNGPSSTSTLKTRRRIGVLVPSTNSTAEPDFHMGVPDGVTVHSHRLWLSVDYANEAAIDGLNAHLRDGARYLAAAKVEAVCMAGTTNSFYKGVDGSTWMESEMHAGSGLPSVASSPSVAQALRHYGARKISIATPYPEWNNGRLREYFTSVGFDVLNVDGDPRIANGNAQVMNDQDPASIADFAVGICREEADAVFCSCSGWRAMEAAAEIERRTGKVVITTNQATIWRTLSLIGINEAKPGFGRLLAEMPPVSRLAQTPI
jgi:maleate isomerase